MLWRWNCRIVITASQCRKVPVSLSRNRFLKVEVSPLSSLHRPAFHWAWLPQKVSQVPWVYQLNRVFQNHKVNQPQRVLLWVPWNRRAFQVLWVNPWRQASHKVSPLQKVHLWVLWNRRVSRVPWVSPWRLASHKVSPLQQVHLWVLWNRRAFQVPWVSLWR